MAIHTSMPLLPEITNIQHHKAQEGSLIEASFKYDYLRNI